MSRIIKFTFDIFLIQIIRYRIINIQQGNCVFADAGSDIFTEGSIDINLTGNRNSSSSQTAVYITGHKSKLRLKSRPAFSGKRHIFAISFVFFDPIQQSQFILCQFFQNFRFFIPLSQLSFHIRYYFRDSLIPCMFVESFKKIQF